MTASSASYSWIFCNSCFNNHAPGLNHWKNIQISAEQVPRMVLSDMRTFVNQYFTSVLSKSVREITTNFIQLKGATFRSWTNKTVCLSICLRCAVFINRTRRIKNRHSGKQGKICPLYKIEELFLSMHWASPRIYQIISFHYRVTWVFWWFSAITSSCSIVSTAWFISFCGAFGPSISGSNKENTRMPNNAIRLKSGRTFLYSTAACKTNKQWQA